MNRESHTLDCSDPKIVEDDEFGLRVCVNCNQTASIEESDK